MHLFGFVVQSMIKRSTAVKVKEEPKDEEDGENTEQVESQVDEVDGVQQVDDQNGETVFCC